MGIEQTRKDPNERDARCSRGLGVHQMVADVDSHLRVAAEALERKEQPAWVGLVAGRIAGADDHGEVPVDPFARCNLFNPVPEPARDDALLDPVLVERAENAWDAGIQMRMAGHHLVRAGDEVLCEGTHKLGGGWDSGHVFERGRHREADRLPDSLIPGGWQAHLAECVIHALDGALRRVCKCVVEVIENRVGPHRHLRRAQPPGVGWIYLLDTHPLESYVKPPLKRRDFKITH